MRYLTTITAVVLGLATLSAPALAGSKKPFTATAVQSIKDQQQQSGKIYVSGASTRFEYVERGREIVKIVLPKQKVMRILFPQEKLYMEILAPADVPMVFGDDDNPCPQIDGLTCTKVGEAKFGELTVQQWKQYFEPTKSTSTLWWEPIRKMIVRQEFADGRIMQLTKAANTTFEGRETERWDVSLAVPDGTITTSYRLVDTDLGIILKEEDPSTGLSRELRELKVADSDATWFDVPAGYQRIDAPKPGQ